MKMNNGPTPNRQHMRQLGAASSFFGHPTAQGRVLATLGKCKHLLSLLGAEAPPSICLVQEEQ